MVYVGSATVCNSVIILEETVRGDWSVAGRKEHPGGPRDWVPARRWAGLPQLTPDGGNTNRWL